MAVPSRELSTLRSQRRDLREAPGSRRIGLLGASTLSQIQRHAAETAMSQFPTIPLQPVARPVDQFVQPARRDASSKLLELAHALKVSGPSIHDIIERRTAAEIQGQQAQAQALQAQRKFANMQA